MSDGAAVMMAVAAAAGALVGHPLPLMAPALVSVAGVALRRPLLVCIGVGLAASALAARSWDGLQPPVTGPWTGTVTLVSDPAPAAGALRADVRLKGKRVDAWWRGRAAGAVRDRLAGERVTVRGTVQPVPPRLRARLARRHVAARLSVTSVEGWSSGGAPARVANGLRRTLLAGAASMGDRNRALFAGFILGDDRDQVTEVAHDFRSSGLSHLLVVSGQNVAFVLAVVAPLTRRMGFGSRMAAGLTVLFLFGVLTRWEPSVLRATAMAAVSLLATTLGRPVSTVRLLALAVTLLLLIDPMLVKSVGFLLSVGACTGIAVFARRFTEAIPGPRPLAAAMGVTLAAQAGVAPVLVPIFGGLPVASLPANLLAAPAAGPLMMWGMAAGLPAGLAGGAVARLIHVPSSLLVDWVAVVARQAAALPLGHLVMSHLVVVAVAVTGAVVATACGMRRWPRRLAGLTVLAVVVSAMVAEVRPGAVDGHELVAGARLWRRGGATVLVVDAPRISDRRLLSALHAAHARRLDVVVVARPGKSAARAVFPTLRRLGTGMVVAPPGHALASATVPPPGSVIVAGGLAVVVESVSPRLQVRVTRRAALPPR